MESWDLNNRFDPTYLCACPKPGPGYVVILFALNSLRWEVLHFCSHILFILIELFKLSFYNTGKQDIYQHQGIIPYCHLGIAQQKGFFENGK